MLSEKLDQTIRDISDFPKPGIVFKDITPILSDPQLCEELCAAFVGYWKNKGIEGIAGVESRGFLFGPHLAMMLGVPFIPVRKAGKLPHKTISHSYDLEYGSAKIEMHIDAVSPGQKIMIHDDLLATGGSAGAASELIKKAGGEVLGFSFIIELGFLSGNEALKPYSSDIQSLITY